MKTAITKAIDSLRADLKKVRDQIKGKSGYIDAAIMADEIDGRLERFEGLSDELITIIDKFEELGDELTNGGAMDSIKASLMRADILNAVRNMFLEADQILGMIIDWE